MLGNRALPWFLLLVGSALPRLLGQEPPAARPPADRPPPATAPQVPTTPRLGLFTWQDAPSDRAALDGFTQGLRDAGLEPQWVVERAHGDAAKAAAGLAALQRADVALVVALGTEAALRARQHLTDRPVLFLAVSHPIASGLVASWDGSGSMLCGASTWIAPAEVLAVFRLAVPHLRQLGMLRSTASNVVAAAEAKTMREHLATLTADRVELHEAFAATPADLPRALAELRQASIDALWIPIDAGIPPQLPALVQLLAGTGLPLLTTAPAALPAGAHVGALIDSRLHGRRAAALALAVLRGRPPGQLPIDRMRSNRVVVNLFAARRAGVDLPLSLLALADELLDPDLPHVAR